MRPFKPNSGSDRAQRLARVAVLAAVFAAVAAGAAETGKARGPNTDPAAKLDAAQSPALSAVERLALSDRLAAYGDRNGDPVALVQAAKIRKGTSAGKGNAHNSFEALLSRAEALAPGNATIAALIADARNYKSRDLPLVSAGVSALDKLIGRNAADRADLVFKGETPAVVYVQSPSAADLDLYVYDEYNNLVCSDEGTGSDAQCRWRPRWTGSFLVDVRNKNDREVEYVLTANYVDGAGGKP
jgi:hypothetical protein